MKLQRYADNPILSANPDNDWESLCVCNPAVWYEDGMFTMLYRAAGGDINKMRRVNCAPTRSISMHKRGQRMRRGKSRQMKKILLQ